MAVVLAILKWIGIVLGGILGLLLLLTALLLLVPARYYIRGTGMGKEILYTYRVSWLLRILEIRKNKKSQAARLYVFGIPVCRLSGDREKAADGDKVTNKGKVPNENKASNGDKAPNEGEVPEKAEVENRTSDKTKGNITDRKKTEKKVLKIKPRSKKKKKSFSFEKVSSIIRFIRDAENRRAFRKIKREIHLLFRYLAPRKVKGQFVIGTGDPAATGLLFGGISLLPFVYREGVHIYPDFENRVFQAEGYMKGRIRILYLIRLVIRVYPDKELRMLWKNVNQVNKKEAA